MQEIMDIELLRKITKVTREDIIDTFVKYIMDSILTETKRGSNQLYYGGLSISYNNQTGEIRRGLASGESGWCWCSIKNYDEAIQQFVQKGYKLRKGNFGGLLLEW